MRLKIIIKIVLLLLTSLFFACSNYSLIKKQNNFQKLILADIFTDNMVLQRDKEIRIWGWAEAGEKILVKIAGQEGSAYSDKSGKWLVILKPIKAGGPFSLIISGKTEITLTNIMIGDVWICSGQSNMHFVWACIGNILME